MYASVRKAELNGEAPAGVGPRPAAGVGGPAGHGQQGEPRGGARGRLARAAASPALRLARSRVSRGRDDGEGLRGVGRVPRVHGPGVSASSPAGAGGPQPRRWSFQFGKRALALRAATDQPRGGHRRRGRLSAGAAGHLTDPRAWSRPHPVLSGTWLAPGLARPGSLRTSSSRSRWRPGPAGPAAGPSAPTGKTRRGGTIRLWPEPGASIHGSSLAGFSAGPQGG